MRTLVSFVFLLVLPISGVAELYSYVNQSGDYVITKERPRSVNEYAVLTDEGEFIELIRVRDLDVPITHWRPWYLPKEPHPMDGVEPDFEDRQPEVIVEEVDDEDGD